MAVQRCITWGLLGTARINQAVIRPIRASKSSQLVAVGSRSSEKAADYARKWGIPKHYGSYDELLEDPSIDVIYNSLPNGLHAEWSIKAMLMGKHVLCEKPIATTVEDLDRIIEAAKQTGRKIAEAFMYRHHAQTIFVKKMIDQGEIGQVQLIKGSFCYTNTRPDNIRLKLELGGGSLWDVGCYPISYTRYLIGEEPELAYGYQVSSAGGIDLMYAGQLIFPNGVIALIDSSFISPYRGFMEITGDKGRISIPEPYKPGRNNKIFLERDGRRTKTIPIRGAELYMGEIEDMEGAVLHGKPTRISLAESRGNITAIEAFYQSARLSKPIHIHNDKSIYPGD